MLPSVDNYISIVYSIWRIVMTRIDFYIGASDKNEVARKLSFKAYSAGSSIFILTNNERESRIVDEYLWSHPLLSFLPHAIFNSSLSSKSSILIGDKPEFITNSGVLINLSKSTPSSFDRFERLLEIVTDDKEDKESARSRYRFYKDSGYSIKTHDLGEVS
jgi:DNA polymerase-3 subunit chi